MYSKTDKLNCVDNFFSQYQSFKSSFTGLNRMFFRGENLKAFICVQ